MKNSFVSKDVAIEVVVVDRKVPIIYLTWDVKKFKHFQTFKSHHIEYTGPGLTVWKMYLDIVQW